MVRKSVHPEEGAELKQLWQQLGRHTFQIVDMLRSGKRDAEALQLIERETEESAKILARLKAFYHTPV